MDTDELYKELLEEIVNIKQDINRLFYSINEIKYKLLMIENDLQDF